MSDKPSDSGRGGRPGEFPTTHWSVFANLESAEEAAREGAMRSLAAAYWKPLYAFVRARYASSNDEARELTQDFFLWVVETGFMSRADRRRGRFRAFVKTALKNYLVTADRRDRAQKRGGGATWVEFDEASMAALAEPGAGAAADPEQRLDQIWAAELIRRAMIRLRESYETEGRNTYYEVFRDTYYDVSQDGEYKAAAERHGISVSDVSNYLKHAKHRFRGILRELVAETVGDEEDLDAEIRELFGG